MCACVCVSSLLFFAFIVHLQPLRRSRHVCVCMCESSGNSFATSYGHDVLEIWCGLIAHCDPDCCFFFVLFLNYNLDITVPLVFLVACGECRCNLYGHMDAAVYVCTCLGVWLCVYAWRINTISKCSMCVNSVFVSNLFFVHCPLSSLCMSLLIHSSSKFFVVQRIKSTLEP